MAGFFFLSWLRFPLQTGNSMQFPLWFCAILAPLKKYRFTGRRTHLSVSRHFMQNTIFPPMKTRKLEYHSLSYMFPRSDLLHISICSGRGLFKKNYFNTVQLTYHIWTTNPASLAYWNFFHNIKCKFSLAFHGVTKMLYGGEKKLKWKALHYKCSFFYKFSLASGDLPSWYWASMSKLRREVACIIRSIYKAKHKLVQYHIYNSHAVTHVELDILCAEVNN